MNRVDGSILAFLRGVLVGYLSGAVLIVLLVFVAVGVGAGFGVLALVSVIGGLLLLGRSRRHDALPN
ncbi:MAG: hypothetical protein ACRDZV_05490 [Acidimicrobiia bacterium]